MERGILMVAYLLLVTVYEGGIKSNSGNLVKMRCGMATTMKRKKRNKTAPKTCAREC